MRLSLFACLLGLTTVVSPVAAQSGAAPLLTGTITDEAGSPLPYATVGVVGKPIGTVADANGAFRLSLPATVAPDDSIQFALLGYRRQYFRAAALLTHPGAPDPTNALRIKLPENAAELPAVSVHAPGMKVQKIGNHHYKTRLQTNFAIGAEPGQNVGSEIGRIFQLPRKGVWLDRFRFVVSGNTFDTVRFRINVYSLRHGVPDQPLLQQPIYKEISGKRATWVEVDLRPANLFVEDEVAVAVEWVSHSRKGQSLATPLLMPAFATHLYRYGAANHWKRFPGMSACMELTVLAPLE